MLGKKDIRQEKSLLGEIELSDILVAIHDLIVDGEIPFAALEPVYKDFHYAELIEAYTKKRKRLARQRILDMKKSEIESRKKDIEHSKREIDKRNSYIAELKAELEETKNKRDPQYNDHIRDLLWWIFNNEENIKVFEDELRNKEAQLKKAEEELLNN